LNSSHFSVHNPPMHTHVLSYRINLCSALSTISSGAGNLGLHDLVSASKHGCIMARCNMSAGISITQSGDQCTVTVPYSLLFSYSYLPKLCAW